MAVFIIGDLHLSLACEKPMDVFCGWQDYVARLEENWRALVAPQDTVLLAGDTSWGMSLSESLADFRFLQALPGRKVLIKGNHDYWWTTVSKMTDFFQENGLSSLEILHNNSVLCEAEGLALCGTRGWLAGQQDAHGCKVYAREVGRLKASLSYACEHFPQVRRVAVLHYPPVYTGGQAQDMLDVLREFDVQQCFYGHLHAASIRRAVQGTIQGVEYRLISADALQFCPYKI